MLTESQEVTIPMLDDRVADLRAEIRRVDHKVDITKIELDGKIDVLKAELETKMEVLKTEVLRWVFFAVVSGGAIQAAVTAFVNAVQDR